jgi:hypothetical protein
VSAITTAMLYQDAGLNSDGVTGWETQIASGLSTRMALWPGHLTGERWIAYEKGARMAMFWLRLRAVAAGVRRGIRNRDFKTEGATSCLRVTGEELKREQLEHFRLVCGSRP